VPRVLLIGMGPTSLSALESLAARLEVVGLVREPPAGRDAAWEVAQRLGIPCWPDTAPAAVDALVAELRPDCVVVSSYNRILSAATLARSRFVNVHYAPLPQYRGRANVNWAIINGEPLAAISIHVMVPELDAGNILLQRTVPIRETDTVLDLYERLNAIQRQHLADVVLRHLAGYAGEPQDEAQATYGCARLPEDGEIDWAAPSDAIVRLVRALAAPYPGAYSYVRGRRLTIWRAAVPERAPRYVGRVPGRVVRRDRAAGTVDVLSGDGVVRLAEVQLDGEEIRPAAEVIRSTRETLGLRVGDLLDRIAALEREVAQLAARRARE